MTLEYATGVDIGDRKREHGGINEDSVAVSVFESSHLDTTTHTGIFVLADGAGGEEAGEIASYIASTEVSRRLIEELWDARRLEKIVGGTDGPGTESVSQPNHENAPTMIERNERLLDEHTITSAHEDPSPDWITGVIETAIQATNTRLLQLINELGLEAAYTTILAGVKVGNRFCYGWVGDSRAYVVNLHSERDPNERISLLTRDHSVVQQLFEKGDIDEIEAHVHRQGNRVTRALGGRMGDDPAENVVAIETGDVELYSDDVLLLTSDGLIDACTEAPQLHDRYTAATDTSQIEAEILEKSVTNDDITGVLLRAKSLDEAVDQYVDLANDRGGKDNISMILARDSNLDRSPSSSIADRSYEYNNLPITERKTVTRDPEYE